MITSPAALKSRGLVTTKFLAVPPRLKNLQMLRRWFPCFSRRKEAVPPLHEYASARDLDPRSYEELEGELRRAVTAGDREKSDQLLRQLLKKYPVPTADIVHKEVWGWEKDGLVIRTHASADLWDAVRNVEKTGRTVREEEENQLRTIMSHGCWWSPTALEHQNDSWMRFLRYEYPALEGLQPILDTLIWPEEIAHYPVGLSPLPPWLFLLATKDKFYIYNFQEVTMKEAGSTLTEVLDGLRHRQWEWGSSWPDIEDRNDEDPHDYFPEYDAVKHTTEEHDLVKQVRDFSRSA